MSSSSFFSTSYLSELLDLGDPRVLNWPLMSSPFPTLLIELLYLLIYFFGPKVMASHSPFSLRKLIIVYDGGMILLNFYIALSLLPPIYIDYNWTCEPVNYSNSPPALQVASALWLYYISKALEMLDTLFFILKKQNSHLSFLHVYHHSSMFALWWIGVKYVAGGSSALGALINSLVHVLMYSYYLLTAAGLSKHLRGVKKYLTALQMSQFVVAMSLGVNSLLVGCNFPSWMQYALILYMISLMLLFGNFYLHTYMRSEKKIRIEDKKKK